MANLKRNIEKLKRKNSQIQSLEREEKIIRNNQL